MKYAKLLLLIVVLFTFSGCGYHLAGTGSSLPTHIKTIGVPIFVNNTQGYEVEQKITADVINVLIQRGRYDVKPETEGMDATLKGTISSVSLVPITFNSDGRAREYNVIIYAKVIFTDEIEKKVIFQNPAFLFRGKYEIDENEVQFFDRQSQAIDDIAQDFAESVVSAILEGF
jgi:outer membrane lipopolysaccharide assembly protein LptE/RlpB